MTKNYPGSIFVREYADDIEKEIRIGPACWTADLGFPDFRLSTDSYIPI